MKKLSQGEELMALHIRASILPTPEREYRFAAMACGGTGRGVRERLRKAGLKDWRFDFAFPGYGIALEVEGGTRVQGRHSRHDGYQEDCLKYSMATILNWKVIRVTTEMVKAGVAMELLQQTFGHVTRE